MLDSNVSIPTGRSIMFKKNFFVRYAISAALISLASPVLAQAPVAAGEPVKKTTSPNAGKRVTVERVVAVVNNSIIMRSELDARLLPVVAEADSIADPKERARRIDKLTGQVLEEMVNEQLIVEAADAARIEVEADDINATLDDIKKQNNLDDPGLTQALAQQGYTLAGYRADLRRQLLRVRAINTLVRPKVTVSDEEVRASYDQMSRRASGNAAVRLSQMLFKTPDRPTEQQIAEAQDKAAKAIARVRAGEPFAKVVAEVSQDDGTKASGGDLGWFERGSMSNPEWESVVFSMDKGDVRGPLNGPQGFHVFLLAEVKANDMKKFEEMKEQIRGELTRRAMDKQTQTWLGELRKKAFVETKLNQ
jgi:peptidyl-prolyl cis-trans isomerase SurA